MCQGLTSSQACRKVQVEDVTLNPAGRLSVRILQLQRPKLEGIVRHLTLDLLSSRKLPKN
jgi:hypothetical protein